MKYLRKRRVSFTLSFLPLPSLDTFHTLYFNFPVSGPLSVGFAQHPSPGPLTGTPSLVLPALSPSSFHCSSLSSAALTTLSLWLVPCSLTFAQATCYSCSVCAAPAGAAFPAAPYCAHTALKPLWFSSALLLSLLGCQSTFQVLLHSGLKHCLRHSFSSAPVSSWERRPCSELFPKQTRGWSRSWDVEHKPSCRWDPPGLDAYQHKWRLAGRQNFTSWLSQ